MLILVQSSSIALMCKMSVITALNAANFILFDLLENCLEITSLLIFPTYLTNRLYLINITIAL